jgi:hypothetical protein
VKNKIIILMMALMIVGLLAGSAAASDWEAVGGLSITTVTLDQWNAKVDSVNEVLSAEGSPLLIDSTNKEEMDNIDKVPMFFIGAEKEINDKWSTEFRYEYIFGTVEGSADVTYDLTAVGGSAGTSKHEAELDVKMHGLAALAKYQINNNWSTRGGIGFYNGTKTKKVSGPVFVAKGVADDNEYDLDAISYRLGVGYERSFAQNWSFNGNIDYLLNFRR